MRFCAKIGNINIKINFVNLNQSYVIVWSVQQKIQKFSKIKQIFQNSECKPSWLKQGKLLGFFFFLTNDVWILIAANMGKTEPDLGLGLLSLSSQLFSSVFFSTFFCCLLQSSLRRRFCLCSSSIAFHNRPDPANSPRAQLFGVCVYLRLRSCWVSVCER